jgi:hypothetical protein
MDLPINEVQLLDTPQSIIPYQPITVNIHYPNDNDWSLDIILDLFAYSNVEDKQGCLQLVRSWNDMVMDALDYMNDGVDHGEWNCDEYHHLGDVKICPQVWRTHNMDVYKVLIPSRVYFMAHTFNIRQDLMEEYT